VSDVTFADLVALAVRRDAFLAENDVHCLVHFISDGEHHVEITYLTDDPEQSHASVQATGEHFWMALRSALDALDAARVTTPATAGTERE
jgi:hypothetical protein